METSPTPVSGPVVNLRVRSIVTTILVAMIAVLIVRDILARRWAGSITSGAMTAGRVTSGSSCDSERQPPSAYADA